MSKIMKIVLTKSFVSLETSILIREKNIQLKNIVSADNMKSSVKEVKLKRQI